MQNKPTRQHIKIEERSSLTKYIDNYFKKLMILIFILNAFIIIVFIFLIWGHLHLHLLNGDEICKDISIKIDIEMKKLFTSILKGDDFGVGHMDIKADDGAKYSSDCVDWGITFNRQFGDYHSYNRNSDAKFMAHVFDYLRKVHDVKYINKGTIQAVFSENPSARDWYDNYDNSWSRRTDEVKNNTTEFRNHLRSIKYYKNYK